MSEDRCPFCGAEDQPVSSNSMDHCEWLGEYADKLKGVRSIYCYERELARLKEWARGVTKEIPLVCTYPVPRLDTHTFTQVDEYHAAKERLFKKLKQAANLRLEESEVKDE